MNGAGKFILISFLLEDGRVSGNGGFVGVGYGQSRNIEFGEKRRSGDKKKIGARAVAEEKG